MASKIKTGSTPPVPLYNYVGLEGVTGLLQGPMVTSVTGFMRALREHRTCSAAGDHGALQAWKDDAGEWRAAFMRFGHVLEQQVWLQKRGLRDWLAMMLPAMDQARPPTAPSHPSENT